MLGPSIQGSLGASLGPSNSLPLSAQGSRKGYENSYGLIRKGDTARKAAEARAAAENAKKEKEKEKSPDSATLEQMLSVMEEAWAN